MIDERLRQDCLLLGRFPLCHVLLMKDANYPWVIMVPDRENIQEIYQLGPDDQHQLWKESAFLGERLMCEFSGDKLNVAALGNVVPQLHVHHIVRYTGDAAWPAPVWGKFAAKSYDAQELARVKNKILQACREYWQ